METTTLVLTAAGVLALMIGRRALAGSRSGTTKEEIKMLMDHGAIVLDVRTPGEFDQGHVPGSRNIPLDCLASRMEELDPNQPILVCCASGARSGAAKSMLDKAGFTQVRNAGAWHQIKTT